MAILQKMADEIEARIGGKGLSVFFVKDTDRRPKVNNFFTNLAAELTTRGITAQRINEVDNYDRGVLIVYHLVLLQHSGNFQKIMDSQVIRYIITFTYENKIEDFEKIMEKTIEDPQGTFFVQVCNACNVCNICQCICLKVYCTDIDCHL